ncbi:hypothetical protein C2S51_036423 [Perilla frutescens var. frutescens]|nr:hypothetical protein C2S51_036423 [Perilla frutescens var. frutescens]
MWRVGNGNQIKVWGDKWIPNLLSGIIPSDSASVNRSMKVADLIKESDGVWDINKLDSLFSDEISILILKIHLPFYRENDRCFWKYNKNGIYSVKSGYTIACHQRDHHQAAATSSNEGFKEILPVAGELKRRHLDCDTMCRRCGVAEETLEHCLRDCIWSSFFWKVSPLRLENVQSNHLSCISMAVKLQNEYQDAVKREPLEQRLAERHTWQKPPIGVWKVNVDASVKESGDVGLGIIIRDHQGNPIVSRCKKISAKFAVDIAEGFACHEGLMLAREFRRSKIIVESDCLEIQQQLHGEVEDLSYRGALCQSIRMEARSFEQVTFSWAKRTANAMTHSLANLAVSNPAFFSFTGDVPGFIFSNVPSVELLFN